MLTKKEQKWIKSLKIKKYRQSEGFFLIEGNKNVKELINSDFEVSLLIGTNKYFQENKEINAERTELVDKNLLGQLSHFSTNETVLAVAKIPKQKPLNQPLSTTHFILDGVSDPGNLGTIIRTMDWFGFDKIICSKNCTDFYQPKVISSTMGSFTRVEPYYLDLEKYIQELQIPIYGADMDGVSINKISTNQSFAVVMGSESHGISSSVRNLLEKNVAIPNFGKAESLNVAVATSIIAAYLRIS